MPELIVVDKQGDSPSFRQAYRLVEMAAETNVTVLLSGETGVGRERCVRFTAEASMLRSLSRQSTAQHCRTPDRSETVRRGKEPTRG
ncbi:sigma 54-interacting transcriptional regulator [Massilia sp. Root418]|uniref:sigma 54-interacting transcriptional regulator n=1 Tax=Massilia sp. Root418 TaxID=1736532 RepID=UPI0019108D78